MRPPSGITIDTPATKAPPPNDDEQKKSSSGKPTRCSCGNLIVHIQHDESGRTLSPRQHTVFNRLYRHRLTLELHHRKLAAEQIEKEAREYTYIPITNNVRQELLSTSSLSGIAHRERTIEMARERFNQGTMCVECLKKVEISTGTFILDDELLANERSGTTQSLPISPTNRSKELPPNQIEFRIAPKPEMVAMSPVPRTPNRKPVPEVESRNDETPVVSIQQHNHAGRETSPVKVNREENASFGDIRPPREILVPSPVASEKKEVVTKRSVNRFGFPGPSPTGGNKKVAEAKSDDKHATPKPSLPPRASTPTHSAFSFDAVSPIPSSEEHPKVETIDSHTTAILKNIVVEESVQQLLLLGSSSHASTASSDIPLRLDSYVSIDVVPETPRSVPYDEKTIDRNKLPTNPTNDDADPDETETAMQKETTSPPVSPASKESESMRKVSILDCEDSFNGPIFVKVTSTKEADNHVAGIEVEQKDNWTEQITGCVACDGAAAAQESDSSSIIDDEENVEQQAADRAYTGCDLDPADMECVDLADETDAAEEIVPEDYHVAKETLDDNVDVPFDEQDTDFKDQEKKAELEREAWLEQATEWAAYVKPASSAPTEEPAVTSDQVKNEKTVTVDEEVVEEESKPACQGEVTFAPTDEEQVFFGNGQSRSSAGDKSSESEPFFGGTPQNSGDKSTACSTVALTEESNCDGHTKGLSEGVRTSEGDFDELLDRFTDCVTCCKLQPWPVHHQK